MRPLNQKIQAMVWFVLLSAIHVWGYTNPIDGPTTETVTNLWDLGSDSLLVGFNTDGNTMIITNGGRVYSAGGTVGGRMDSDNNRVLISGSGSIWSNSALLLIGPYGVSNAVIVSNGGKLYSNGCGVGDQPAIFSRIVVTGSGSIFKNAGGLTLENSELLISNGGRVEATDGVLFGNLSEGPSVVTGTGSAWINSGHLEITSSELIISDGGRVESDSGRLVPFGGGPLSKVTITGTDSIWVNSSQLSIDGGELTISDGGRLETGNVRGGFFHLQSGGALAVSGDFDADQIGAFDFTGGTLSVGGTLSNFFMLASGCRLEASDLLGDLTVHGTFAPGQSPADTMLDGAFVLSSDGTLEMELAGYLLGTEYDRLTVTGESMLDGTLSILLLDGFTPVYGATFDLFNWNGGVGGTFAVTNLPTLGNGLFWDTGSLYTDGTVSVVPEPSTFLLLGIGLVAFGVYTLRNKVYEF